MANRTSPLRLSCEALLFDMDGTLVDSTAIVEQAWAKWAKRHNLPLPEILAFSHGRPTKDTMEYFLPGTDVRKEAEEMLRYEETETEGIRAVAGAQAVVRVAQAGPWAVVTSAPRRLAEIRLADAGLPIPKVLVPADEIIHGKPDPESYLKAAQQLNVAPARCLVFEDTRPGIEAAQSAGMQAVGLLTTFPHEKLGCEWAIRDFTEIRLERRDNSFQIFFTEY